MRKAALLAVVALASCNDEQPQRGVDTTLPAEPAKITGSLSAPNEYMPDDNAVCAETPDGQKAYCNAEISKSVFSGTYTLAVPPGSYRVFARTQQVPNYKAYFDPCTSALECPSHAPTVVKVQEGEERTGIDPADWFNRPVAPTAPDNAYGGYGDYEGGASNSMNVDENLTTTDLNAEE